MRLANAPKIRTIDFARSGINGTGSLSPRARRTLAVYVILVKMKFEGISAPMGAIADAVWRSSNGEARSIRTLQRSNQELLQAGYISAPMFRPSKSAVIYFNLPAFAYWTGKKSKSVTPLTTQSYNVVPDVTKCDTKPHTTDCRTSDRTKDNVQVNSLPSDQSIDKEQRAGARANKKTYPRKKKNAVLFSILMVLPKLPLSRSDTRTARNQAEVEIKAMAAGIEILQPSGVDWAYWESRWGEFSIIQRENIVRTEILPYLIGVHPKTQYPMTKEDKPNVIPTSKEDIRSFRAALEKAFPSPSKQQHGKAELATNNNQTPKESPAKTMDDESMRILLAARDRAGRRVNSM